LIETEINPGVHLLWGGIFRPRWAGLKGRPSMEHN